MKKWVVFRDKFGIYWTTYGKIIEENDEFIELDDKVSGEIETWDKEDSMIFRCRTEKQAEKIYNKQFIYKE